MLTTSPAELLVVVDRNGIDESSHHGHIAVTDPDGAVCASAGEAQMVIFGRSALKPLQAVAALRAGADLLDDQLAIACASHSGETEHLQKVQAILARIGLTEDDLDNTPDLPLNAKAAVAWQCAGGGPSRITQNCSGKHAAMLAACVAQGWELTGYLQMSHPLQQRIAATVAELTGDELGVGVDGCGAPAFTSTLAGLARAFGRIAAAPAGTVEARVAKAMSTYPFLVGGTGRLVTALMPAVPGLVAKDGAEGVVAVGLPDGRGIAVKILDGANRARAVAVAATLAELGITNDALRAAGTRNVLGHGEVVGAARPVFQLQRPGPTQLT
jgi:L-asparaginase II